MKGNTYTEEDMVSVVNEAGVVQENKIPKQWLGTDLAPGLKKAGRVKAAAAENPNEEPAGNASREDWAAYAKSVKGVTDADLVDAEGKELGRDELREKFGTPAS